MNNLNLFQQFASKNRDNIIEGINAVIYTRVSDPKQEDNTSLESQKKKCESFAKSQGFNIIEYFGGSVESAKTDDRKEFNKMLTYVKRSKNVTYIIVNSYERFTRSGVSGMYIAQELMKQYKVVILSATQGIDPRTITGAFQQNIMFLVGQMDNEQRREKTVTGMRELLLKGYCPHGIPRGYSNLNKGRAIDQKIIVNEEGKILRKAFIWKAEQQMRNVDIVKRLAELGVKMDERRLAYMLANPFYCGIIVSRMLPNQVIEGKHQAMISREVFLKANNVVADARNHPVSHSEEDEQLPLKRFTKCSCCNLPMTGYLVKKKKLYYYKCRTTGCNNNKSAKQLHEEFKAVLGAFHIHEHEAELVKQGITELYSALFEEQFEDQKLQKGKITELRKKIDTVEENLAIGVIDRTIFQKFSTRYNQEINEIEKTLQKVSFGTSNLQRCLDIVVKVCKIPLKWWEQASVGDRMIFQNIVFPEGIFYNREKNEIRTHCVNAIFAPIPELIRKLRGIKKGESIILDTFTSRVIAIGFEPMTACLEGRCSIQLSYATVMLT